MVMATRSGRRKGHALHRQPRRGRQMTYSTLTCLQRNDSDQRMMHTLGKSPSAKLSVRAPAMARPWARVRPHRLSFLLGGDDPENRFVEEIPAAGFGGRRHAVHVLCFCGARPLLRPLLPRATGLYRAFVAESAREAPRRSAAGPFLRNDSGQAAGDCRAPQNAAAGERRGLSCLMTRDRITSNCSRPIALPTRENIAALMHL